MEDEEEMNDWIDRLNQMEDLVTFNIDWQVKDKVNFRNSNGEFSSLKYYKKEWKTLTHSIFDNFVKWAYQDMRGCFVCLPPVSIKAPNFLEKFQLFEKTKGSKPPW